MSVTKWERQRAVSDRVRAAWDAHRDGRDWAAVFADACEAVAARLEQDAAMVREMSWDEFKRLQGIGPPQLERR